MKWKALFNDGSKFSYEGEQNIHIVSTPYINRLNIDPFFAIINNKGYSIEESFIPKGDTKILLVDKDNPRVKQAATFALGNDIAKLLVHNKLCKNAKLVENGKEHFIIEMLGSEKVSLVKKFCKGKLHNQLKTFQNEHIERSFKKAPLIFKDEPEYNFSEEIFCYEDLKNFLLSEVLKDGRLHFAMSLNPNQNLIKRNEKVIDHRVLGHDLEIFYLNPENALGMPYWLPNGVIIRETLKEYFRKVQKDYGFQEVSTPILGHERLYQRSGHLEHYEEDMFKLEDWHGEQYYMRPMSCPHHIDIFKMKPRTHKDLPYRLFEYAMLYRKEHSGGLLGIERVTSMELTDGHIFCSLEQIGSEVKKCFESIQMVLAKAGVKIHQFTIAIRDYFDEESYGSDKGVWLKAEEQIIKISKDLGINYKIVVGEAAFYGPKIDLEVYTAGGQNLTTISTIQLDFLLPEKFDLTYLDENKEKQPIVMIHRGLASTFERLISIMITQDNGRLPLLFAPLQIQIIPISIQSKEILSYCEKIKKKLLKENIRVDLNTSNDTLGKKIRLGQKKKINYLLVIGEAEVNGKTISVREHGSSHTDSNVDFKSWFTKIIKSELS